MSSLSTLTVLGLVPLLGAVLIGVVPRGRDLLVKQIALLTSLVVLGITIGMCAQFDPQGGRFQFAESHEWIQAFGVRYSVGVDGTGLVLVALVAVLVPVVLLASWHEADAGGAEAAAEARETAAAARHASTPAAARASARGGSAARGGSVAVLEADTDTGDDRDELSSSAAGERTPRPTRSVKAFFGMLLVLETMMIGVFAATDVFLFYVFFEAMLIPTYFLIGSYGGPRRSYAAVKFLLYSLAGGLLMLAALIGLYVTSAQQLGTGTFDFLTLTKLNISTPVQVALFLGFFIAFAIKAPLFPDASRIMAPYVITLSVIGILYGALLAMGQKDLKRLVSYTSVAHFGFIGLGCFAFTTQGATGAVLYMVNHGLSTGALFLVVGFLVARGRSRSSDDYSGIGKVAPVLAGLFLVAGLSSLALPGLSTFVSEFLVLVGTFTRYRVAAVFATVGIVLAALYILLAYQKTMQGTLSSAHARMKDLSFREVMAVAPLVALMLFLGFYPKPLTDVITPSVERTMRDVGVQDPAPTSALPIGLPTSTGAR